MLTGIEILPAATIGQRNQSKLFTPNDLPVPPWLEDGLTPAQMVAGPED